MTVVAMMACFWPLESPVGSGWASCAVVVLEPDVPAGASGEAVMAGPHSMDGPFALRVTDVLELVDIEKMEDVVVFDVVAEVVDDDVDKLVDEV